MTRKEIYTKIKELGVADKIQAKYGDNYTRVSSANLENFLNSLDKVTTKKGATVEKTPKKEVSTLVETNAVIKLISILQTKKIITAKEAEEVAAAL